MNESKKKHRRNNLEHNDKYLSAKFFQQLPKICRKASKVGYTLFAFHANFVF